MNDELGRAAAEITAGVNAELNRKRLERVRYIVADMVQAHGTPELENLRDRLRREGLQIPFLGCEGINCYDEACSLLKHHTGDCA